MEERSVISSTAEALCNAIIHHSEIYNRENFTPGEEASVELRISELISNYRDIVKGRTGMNVSFRQDTSDELDLMTERLYGEASKSDDSIVNLEPILAREEVFLVDKWHIEINMLKSFIEFARQRIGRDITTIEEALHSLCEKDGWKPDRYPKGLVTLLAHDVQVCSG